MADFQEHEPCPSCGSDDNLARYSDGSASCFSGDCDHWEPPTDQPTTRKKADSPAKVKDSSLITNGEIRSLPKRNISEETCKHFGYQVGTNKNGTTVQIANYYRDNKVVAQKTRDSNKNFSVIGNGKKMPFFGQNKWREGGKRLVVTEGEIDAMSISQLQGNSWPVVSLCNGAQSAAKLFAQESEFLESYEKVIIAFDMDEPGQDAAREAAAMLSPGKAFIAALPAHDANECLTSQMGKALMSSLWDAKQYRPDGIVGVEELMEEALKPLELGKDWPWATATKYTYGRRRAELYGFGGGTGCGKSTLFKQIAKHVVEVDKLPVGLLMLEEPPKLTLKTLAGMFMGKRLHVPGVKFDQEELIACFKSLMGKVHFYDHFGSSTWETIKAKIRFMVRAEGIRDIFLDHITAVAASIDGDERKAIDKLMAELSSLTQELDCTIYYISHLTTPEGKPHEEGGRVLEKHFRGSRSIAFWSHFLFAVERDKQDLNGITTFRILKDRYTGDGNGITFGLAYDKETGLLNECAIPAKGESDGSEFDDEAY